MNKAFFFSLLFIATIFCSKAQSLTSKAFFNTNEKSTSFNFKTASASILSTENALTSSLMAPVNKAYTEKKIKKYHKMKIAGIVLSSLGGAALVGTIAGCVVLARQADWNDGYTYGGTTYYDGNTGVAKTLGLAIGGTFLTAGLVGPGIPLSIIGSKKEKKYKAKLKQQ